MGIFKSSTVNTTSPRISSFSITQSTYGAPLKLVFGTPMISPILIDYDDFTAIAHKTTTSSGGKGGSVKSSNTTYTYTVAVAMALGEGVLTGVGTIWSGSKVTDMGSLGLTFFDGRKGAIGSITGGTFTDTHITLNSAGEYVHTMPTNTTSISSIVVFQQIIFAHKYTTLTADQYTLDKNTGVLTIHAGVIKLFTYSITVNYYMSTDKEDLQFPWGYLATHHPNKALTYSGTSYVAGVIDLGDSSSLPNFNFEVYGLCQSQQGVPTTDKVTQYAYQKTIELSNYNYSATKSSGYVEEYDYNDGWITLNSRYYKIEQSKNAEGNKIDNQYTYTFNFDDRTDGYDRDDPFYIRIHWTATTASVTYTATDANPRDIIYTLLTNTIYGENFPSELVGDLSDYAGYCQRNSLLISPVYETTTQCSEIIKSLMECTNSEYVFSQGKVKIVPFYDSVTPIYDITEDHIIDQGDNSLLIDREDPSDVYNVVPLEFTDRNNQYNTDVVYATDEGNKDRFGLRQMSTLSHHEIMSRSLAQTVAEVIKQKQISIRNTYTVRLGQEFILLEPMDCVTIACSVAGLDTRAVRVVEIKENQDDYSLDFTFEDNPSGALSAPLYETQDTTRASLNLDESAGNANYPVIFEPPDALVNSGLGLEVWIYASGGSNYGGCNVWVSEDNETYKRIGMISGKSRQGILTSSLPTSNSSLDTADTLSVNLSMSESTLASGTQSDADNYNTLCYVDGELLAYETATLTSANNYGLTYLQRGAYGTTISSHDINSQFVRCDDICLKYPFTEADIGKKIYIKLTTFNVYGGGEQDLSDVTPYEYNILGTAEYSPLPQVTGLTLSYQEKRAVLSWTQVTDFRTPICYEIRKGDTFNSASVYGRAQDTKFVLSSNGTYWVGAYYQCIYNGTSYVAYSGTWSDVVVVNASIPDNIIAVFNEEDTHWSGTVSDDAYVDKSNNVLQLSNGIGLVNTIADFASVINLAQYGGVGSYGIYTIPEDHIITISESEYVNTSLNYVASVSPLNEYVSQWEKVSEIKSVSGNDGTQGYCTPQINVMDNDGKWSGWGNYLSGNYYGKSFNFRIIIQSYSPQFNIYVTSLSFSVDVPDKVSSDKVTVPTTGASVTYSLKFNMTPTPTISIYEAVAGDEYFFTDLSSTGFTITIKNNGTAVSRDITYVATGW